MTCVSSERLYAATRDERSKGIRPAWSAALLPIRPHHECVGPQQGTCQLRGRGRTRCAADAANPRFLVQLVVRPRESNPTRSASARSRLARASRMSLLLTWARGGTQTSALRGCSRSTAGTPINLDDTDAEQA